MKNEDRRGREDGNLTEKKKMIQECSLINASPPVNEYKKKLSGVVMPKSSTCPMSFSERRTWTHIVRVDKQFTLSTTKQTSKSC